MRTDERDEQAPGFSRLDLRDLLQPSDRLLADLAVVGEIGGVAGAGVPCKLSCARASRRRTAQHALDIAFAVEHMQRQQFVIEAVGIGAGAIMQLADRIAAVAGLVQAVPPRRWRAGVWE